MGTVLIVYYSRTGRTEKMAEAIAEGMRSTGNRVDVKKVSEISNGEALEAYDALLFGAPTYFKTTADEMKTFLFLALKADLKGKVGGAFGSFTHMGNGPKIVHETMENVFSMDMGGIGPFNVKEQIIDAGKCGPPCMEYGSAISQRLKT